MGFVRNYGTFQPTTAATVTAENIFDIEGSEIVYEAIADSANGSYLIGDRIQVQTVTNSLGTTNQYFNVTQDKVIQKNDYIATDFKILGSTQVNATALMLDAFEFPTVVIADSETVFTLAQAVDAVGKSIPTGTNWIVLDMQANLGTDEDCFIISLDGIDPAITPMHGQRKQSVELKNLGQITNAKFLGVPKVLASQVILVAEFWSGNPNL